ncbi:MAG: hypothetical protein K2X60_06340, partial [Xanthobacteraceae bacterium]|nr:hypothetical protein [Xanthobacteraceae bacterium]
NNGNWHGGYGRHHHGRFFGPAFALGLGAGYYGYDSYYDSYPYDDAYYDGYGYAGDGYYDDNQCYQLQQVHTRHGWRTRRVDVCS